MPIIGHISLAKEMKAALQEADEDEDEDGGGGGAAEGRRPRLKDAKGREILSEEEKARKDEKERKKADEVCISSASRPEPNAYFIFETIKIINNLF